MISFVFCQKREPIDFCKEDIKIEINRNKARVTGTYFFKNLTPYSKRIKFYYPFPVDSNYLFPDTILLAYPYEKDTVGIYFTMVIEPNTTDSFTIAYEQKLKNNVFRYITTTTRKWHRPIKEVRFTVILHQDLSPQINYQITREQTIGNNRYYIIKQERFYPSEDLIIKW
ncbi:MAG: hypothetical protein ACPL28_00900 [bacterium]